MISTRASNRPALARSGAVGKVRTMRIYTRYACLLNLQVNAGDKVIHEHRAAPASPISTTPARDGAVASAAASPPAAAIGIKTTSPSAGSASRPSGASRRHA